MCAYLVCGIFYHEDISIVMTVGEALTCSLLGCPQLNILIFLFSQDHTTKSLFTRLKNAHSKRLAIPHTQDLDGFDHFFPEIFSNS